MELKNLFSKEAQNTYSTVTGGIKKKIKPVVDVGSELVKQNVEAITPAVSQIKETAQAFAEPIVQPIQQFQQKTEKIGKLNTFFSDAGITLDDIKALAEDEGVDFNQVVDKFTRNGIKVQGMEELVAQEQAKVTEEANKPYALDVNPEYDEVTALSRLTGAIPKFQYSPDEGLLKSAGKMVGNLPASAIQMGAGIGDIGLSYLRNLDQGPIDAFTETAKAKIINPTIAQGQSIADTAQEGYKKYAEQAYLDPKTGQDYNLEGFGKTAMGTLGAIGELSKMGSEFIVENPVGAIMTGKSFKDIPRGGRALKTAGQEVVKGNIGKAATGLAKSTGIGIKENIYDPIKMGVTAPFKATGFVIDQGIKLGKKTETGKGIARKIENAKTYLAGLDQNEIGALEKTSPSEIDAILKQAEETKGKQGDYVQTPYHVGATKAQKTLNQLDKDLKTRQSERLAVLDEAPIATIDATDARNTLRTALRDMNVEDIRIVDGKPEIIPVKGREALLDLSNPADVKALQKLNEILDGDVSPTQTMDRVKKLQEWAYENKSTIGVKGTSERMDLLIKRVQGSLNATFKKQLPPEYAKILDSMSEDINLSNEVKRVFGLDDAGNPVGNRGEMVMKRLANGTTTGGEARTLAKQIFDRYGIDLIKEARLRQMAMDLVGDSRGQTLFGVIKGGKQGIIDKTLEYATGKLVNKEKLVRGLAKGKGEVVKKQAPLYTPNAFRKAMAEESRKPLGLPSPTGKGVSAKNVDLNIKTATPKENAMTQKVGERPGTQNKAYILKKEKQKPIQKKNVDRKIIEESKKVIKNAKISTTIPKKEEIKLLAPPKGVPKKTEVITKSNATIKPEVTSAAQARGQIDPLTGKRKTLLQSPTAYEAGIRRPYTLNGNKPIVKRASDSKGLTISKGDEALMSEARKEQIKKGKVIGEGSDRKVIDLGNGTVIKIPKNERGIMQMDVNYNELSNKGLIPKVIEKGKGYVIFEKIENGGKLVESMMKEIDATNYDKKKILSILNDYGYKIDSLDGITINELLNKNNWGVKNGNPIIIDEGIFNNERIFNKGKNLYEIEQNIKYIKGKQKEFKDFQKSINGDEALMSEARRSTMGDMETKKLIEPKNFKAREEQYNKELWDFIEGKSNKTEAQIKAEYKDVSDYLIKKSSIEKEAIKNSIEGLPSNSTDIGENIYYHGTSAEFPRFNRPKVLHGDIFGEGIYLTPDKSGAELYAKQASSKGGEAKIAVVKIKGKIKEIDGSNEMNTPGYTKNEVQKARQAGYDGVKIKHNLIDKGAIRGEDIIMIFEPENAIIQRFASKYKNQS